MWETLEDPVGGTVRLLEDAKWNNYQRIDRAMETVANDGGRRLRSDEEDGQ